MSHTVESVIDITKGQAASFSFVWRDHLDYDKNAEEFESALRPFLIKEDRVSEWPGTTLEYVAATIKFYIWCPESVALLRCVESPTEFLSPAYPEDLAIYKANEELLYGSCSHEDMEWLQE